MTVSGSVRFLLLAPDGLGRFNNTMSQRTPFLLFVSFLALATLADARPRFGQDKHSGIYGSASGGAVFIQDTTYQIFGVGTAEVSFDVGSLASVQVGYDWGNILAEVDFSYAQANVDSIGGASPSPFDFEVEAFSYLVNVLYEFEYKPFHFQLGGGVGGRTARITGTVFGLSANGDYVSAFAYQAIARAQYRITENFSAQLGYRYSSSTDFDTSFDELKAPQIHVIEAGISYQF